MSLLSITTSHSDISLHSQFGVTAQQSSRWQEGVEEASPDIFTPSYWRNHFFFTDLTLRTTFCLSSISDDVPEPSCCFLNWSLPLSQRVQSEEPGPLLIFRVFMPISFPALLPTKSNTTYTKGKKEKKNKKKKNERRGEIAC